eukprot:727225-Pelagomonas_calceolata.AAC.1
MSSYMYNNGALSFMLRFVKACALLLQACCFDALNGVRLCSSWEGSLPERALCGRYLTYPTSLGQKFCLGKEKLAPSSEALDHCRKAASCLLLENDKLNVQSCCLGASSGIKCFEAK